jgi:hypothetical protein
MQERIRAYECLFYADDRTYLPERSAQHSHSMMEIYSRTEAGDLDEPDSAKPAQPSSHTGPPGYIGWTRFQTMSTGGPTEYPYTEWLKICHGS